VVRRAILGDPSPWDPLDLPWDEMEDSPGTPRDRMSTVRDYLEGMTDEMLDSHTKPVDAPGWPRPHSYPVRECLLTVLNEEWVHRLFAERGLDVVETRA
jgi:hypothetical protein